MSALLIESSTPLCLLQDAGRFGVRHLGVTQGGALDWVSMSWANRLLGNRLDAAVVEITLGGLTLVAQQDGCLALAGADLDAMLDERPLALAQFFHSPGAASEFPPTCAGRPRLSGGARRV